MAMHSSKLKAGAAALLLLASGSVWALEPRIERGTHEFGVHFSPDLMGAVGDTIFLDVGYGVFVRDALELRAAASYTLMEDVAFNGDVRAWEVGVGSDYHFALGSRVPYVGAFVAWARTNTEGAVETAFVYGPRLGVKHFLADNAALVLDVAYKFASKDVYLNDFEFQDHDLTTSMGLRLMF